MLPFVTSRFYGLLTESGTMQTDVLFRAIAVVGAGCGGADEENASGTTGTGEALAPSIAEDTDDCTKE